MTAFKNPFVGTTLSRIIAAAVAVASLGSLAACGSSSAGDQSGAANNADAKTINIASATSIQPFDYVDESGNPDGYEVAVLKAADDLLPQYKFSVQPMDWKNIFVSLDSGKVDIASCFLQLNEERKEKYEYTTNPHVYAEEKLAVAKSTPDFKSLEDFAGKTIQVFNGSAEATALEKYNAEHPDKQVKLEYSDATWEQIVASIDKGVYDAATVTPINLEQLNKQYGDKLKLTGPSVLSLDGIFLLNKKDSQLREDLDGAIKKLGDNGTLAKLSQQYLGADYSKKQQ